MRSRGRDADIPGMLRPGGPGMPERGEFQDGEGAAAARRDFGDGITQPQPEIANRRRGFNRRRLARVRPKPLTWDPRRDLTSL